MVMMSSFVQEINFHKSSNILLKIQLICRVRGLSLDLIKRRLDKGVYKRLDRFQEDVFTCLERARKLSRTDSQPFEDSVELQAFFLRTRDDVTRSGDLLHSPALNYTLLDLSTQVAELKRIKIEQEISLPVEDESCDGNYKVGVRDKR